MRVLQIGAGRWGRNHVRSWRRLGVELAVCDTDPAALEGLDAPVVSDPREALTRVDAVDVVTPAGTHPELVQLALEHGRDVFVEKPFALSAEEAFELDALARRRGAVLHVGHVFRFAPEIRALADALRGERIGHPRYLSGSFTGFKRPRSDGGAAISDAIHWVDLASWLLGSQPRAVSATLRECLGRGLDDVALITLDYGEALVQIEAGYFAPEPRRELVLTGSEGSILCDLLANDRRVRLFRDSHRCDDEGSWHAVAGERHELSVAAGEPLLEELREFEEACRTRRPAPVAATGYEGAAAVAVIEACRRSSSEGRRVEIKLPTPAGGPTR